MVKRAVKVYNEIRAHDSLDNRTSKDVHLKANQPYKSFRKNKKIKYLFLTDSI